VVATVVGVVVAAAVVVGAAAVVVAVAAVVLVVVTSPFKINHSHFVYFKMITFCIMNNTSVSNLR